LQFLSGKEISGKVFELRDFTFTSALPVGKDRTKFASCMKNVLVLPDIFQDSIRARDTLRHLARSLPTLLLSHGFKTIQTRCNRLLKGDLEWFWASCTKTGRIRHTRLSVNPHTGKARTTTQLDALAQKLARANNFPKSCQAVCSDSTPSLGPDTLAKLHTKNPQGSVDFDKICWPFHLSSRLPICIVSCARRQEASVATRHSKFEIPAEDFCTGRTARATTAASLAPARVHMDSFTTIFFFKKTIMPKKPG